MSFQKILNDYGRILEQTAPMAVCGIPASLLPHGENEIKEAIKWAWSLPESRESIREQSLLGWVALATFIDDELARIASEGCLLSRIPNALSERQKQIVQRYIQIQKDIIADQESLSRELKDFLSGSKTRA